MLAAALVWQQRSSSGWWEVAVGAGGYKLSRVAPTGLYILTSILYVVGYILYIPYLIMYVAQCNKCRFSFSMEDCALH